MLALFGKVMMMMMMMMMMMILGERIKAPEATGTRWSVEPSTLAISLGWVC